MEPTEENLEARKKLQQRMDNNIKIVSGSVPATPEVIYEGIDVVYNDIVDFQGHGLIGGSYLTNQNEERIYSKVMEKVDRAIDKIREELSLNDV